MPLEYVNKELLYEDDFADLSWWHHEGIGALTPLSGGGMGLVCAGSKQGAQGCMAFFRPTLPDRDTSRYPIPDFGKFGFRLIGSDVKADVFRFRVHWIDQLAEPRRNAENAVYRIFDAEDRLETDYFEGRHQISGRIACDFLKQALA